MMQLLCGVSGSGKTKALLQSIQKDVQAKKTCFLIIPEQQAYITENQVAQFLSGDAGLYLRVLNFSKLTELYAKRFGGVTQHALSKGLRNVFLWKTLRELSPTLQFYGQNLQNDAKISSMMQKTIQDFSAAAIEDDTLDEAILQMPKNAPLQKKLADVTAVNALYKKNIEEVFPGETGDKLNDLAKKLQSHSFFDGCRVYIDSFSGFTEPEYRVIRELCRQAESVTVSLCVDEPPHAPHFESTANCIKRLSKIAADCNEELQKIHLKKPENASDSLSYLGERLWDFSAKPRDISTDETVTLIHASNLYEESEVAALCMEELVQNGTKYHEIAVFVRDLDTYRGVLDAAMERHHIPAFLSERTDLLSLPLSRLILASLRAVASGFRREDVIAILKTGLSGVPPRDCALFEEYCETWKITGSRFLDDVWSMNPDGLVVERSGRAEEILDVANSTKDFLMKPLSRCAANMKQATTLKDRIRVLYEYLQNLQIASQLSLRAQKELETGDVRAGGETLRLYSFFTDSFSELCRVFGNLELSVSDLATVLTLYFSEADLGSVPYRFDSVTVGSADSLRVENVKAVFLLGLCEGEFPKNFADDGIFNDADREELEKYGISLQTNGEKQNSEELLFIYRAVAKPAEKLYLLTHDLSVDGSAKAPSVAFTRAEKLLQKKAETVVLSNLSDSDSTPQSEDIFRILPQNCRNSLTLSQSKIRTYVNCPYSYFCTYELKLREQKSGNPSLADDGTFLHFIFERFLKRVAKNHPFALPEDGVAQAWVDEIVDKYLETVFPIPKEWMDAKTLHLFARLRGLAGKMLQDMMGEIRSSMFVPTDFEKGIGERGDTAIPAVTLKLDNGKEVNLVGKIDRIDTFRSEDGKTYLRVVDYKSGKHEFSTDDLSTGMDIQLVLYLFALLSNDKSAIPAGAAYLFADSSSGRVEICRSGILLSENGVEELADKTEEKVYTKKLLRVSSEDVSQMIRQLSDTVKAIASRIFAGDASKTPSPDACRFCSVKNFCNRATTCTERSHRGKKLD